MTGDRYLLSNDAPEAMDRFTAFATLFDPTTFRHLDGLGLAPGWRCWEVGAGGTTVVAHLAARLARPGTCWPPTSTCPGPRGAAAANVEILEHDVAAEAPPAGPFDLVHARLVLVHVPERDVALANMVAALRPGGVLLVEDADPALQPLSCLGGDGTRRGAGQSSAPRLPHAAGGARASTSPTAARCPAGSGRRDWWAWPPRPSSRSATPRATSSRSATVNLIRDQLLDHGVATEAEIAQHLDTVAAGKLDLAQPPMISCWGHRPLPA